MTAPEITAALEALIASTPPPTSRVCHRMSRPVTVWGVRYAKPAGRIVWHDSETARAALAYCEKVRYPAQLVSITGRVRPADATESGGAR